MNFSKLDLEPIRPNYQAAFKARRAKAHAAAGNAQMRYFAVHIHRLKEREQAVDGLSPRNRPAC
ncbi:MAG: DUF4170 domain-containing protein [Alphaproteobacteria bacterium]|nr:DUF4170 domain-containing protein [Alphaproteobacteria bacterium]